MPKRNAGDVQTISTSSVQTTLIDENGDPYMVHLCKTDLAQNSNKFYDIELFEQPTASANQRYGVKMINGRIGYKGVTNYKFFAKVSDAKDFFNKKFSDKSWLEWEERKSSEPVVGKYVVVEVVKKEVVTEKVVKEEIEVKVEENLEVKVEEPEENNPVIDFLKQICDEKAHLGLLRQLKFNENYGKPIDCLSLAQIDLGYEILSTIENVITAKGKINTSTITYETNRYYSLVPHNFGFSNPPRIDSIAKVQQEKELLDALKGAIETSKDVLACKEKREDKPVVCIFTTLYERLPCEISILSQKAALRVITQCAEYKAPSHFYNISVKNVYQIRQKNDPETAPKIAKEYLWHGTRVTNVYSILQHGLEVPVGPRGDLMFGNGIYFANVPSKAANYCKPELGGVHFLLLCEVAVGKQFSLCASEVSAESMMEKAGCDSVLARGKYTRKLGKSLNKVKIHHGDVFVSEVEGSSELMYDEYIVYKADRVQIRYIVEIEMKQDSFY